EWRSMPRAWRKARCGPWADAGLIVAPAAFRLCRRMHYDGAMPATLPELSALTTPLAWTDADGVIRGCNQAFVRWLGVGERRLQAWPLAALEAAGGRLAPALQRIHNGDPAPLRLRR